jgi:hypothetical protein
MEPTTMEPTTMEPTTMEPTTMEPTTMEPTTMEPTTMEPTTMEPATMEPATMEPTTVERVTVEFAAVFATVEPIMESAEAFAAESAIAEVRGIAVAVRGIAVASVIPPSLATSRQSKGRNQQHAKYDQSYFHHPDTSAGGENDERSGGSAFCCGHSDRRACIQDASRRPHLLFGNL